MAPSSPSTYKVMRLLDVDLGRGESHVGVDWQLKCQLVVAAIGGDVRSNKWHNIFYLESSKLTNYGQDKYNEIVIPDKPP